MNRKVILIAGPTASGKSALAMALAEELHGVVINADSMQVYKELRVLTARPTAEDEKRVPHRLYGHVPGAVAYSAGRFVVEAEAAIAAARTEGHVPIVVGGTGLYFKALLEGLAPVPGIPPDVRQHWRMEVERVGPAALHTLLGERDPGMAARLRPSDPQRITRALEVLEATGRSLAYWQALRGRPVVDPAHAAKLVIAMDRDALLSRCDDRFASMVSRGAIDEVRALMDLALAPDLPVMRALGVRPLIQLARCEVSLDEAVAEGQKETRKYVKRQQTWLRSNMYSWNAITAQQMKTKMQDIVSFIRS